jgi:Serine/threonine protein kinase
MRDRLRELFHEFVDLPSAERARAVDEAAGEDVAFRLELATLIEADRGDDDFLEQPACAVLASSLKGSVPLSAVGTHFGPYLVLDEIGNGGMGSVFLAVRDDEEFEKYVAVKVIQGIRNARTLDRFRTERQILAGLEHPNIARLIDGGTNSDGLPYLVMEYVDGVAIDVYCRQQQLSLEERLRLVRDVCAAVEYAHQSLVVHRDLKPGNILVTSDGVAKLLDFGIARLAVDDGESPAATVTQMGMLTPDYASPEQILGKRIGTRSDVYSLGVILYELLAGTRPYRIASKPPHEMVRAVCEDEPDRMSVAAARDKATRAVNYRIDTDLDNIVMMAMRKDQERRYRSVKELSDDIERYLNHQTVIARPDSFAYRARKFVRRNVVPVSAASLLLLSFVVGVVSTLRQSEMASFERARAERRFQDLRHLADSMLFEVHDSLQRVPGSLAARQLIVSRAMQYFERLERDAVGDHALEADIAAAYDHVGMLTFDVEQSLRSHRKAVLLYRSIVAMESGNEVYREGLVTSLLDLADVQKIVGDYQGALATCRQAMPHAAGLVASHPRNLRFETLLQSVALEQGAVLTEIGDDAGGLAAYRQALTIAQRMVNSDAHDPNLGHQLLIAELRVGYGLSNLGDQQAAFAHFERAMALTRSLLASDPLNAVYRRDLWSVNRGIGRALTRTGDTSGALDHLGEALAIIQSLAAADLADAGHRRTIVITQLDIGGALAAAGRRREALASYRSAREISESLVKNDPRRIEARFDLAQSEAGIGAMLLAVGNAGDAVAPLQHAVVLYRPFAETMRNDRARRPLAIVSADLATARKRSNALKAATVEKRGGS